MVITEQFWCPADPWIAWSGYKTRQCSCCGLRCLVGKTIVSAACRFHVCGLCGLFLFLFFYLVPFSVAFLNIIAQNTNTNLLFQCKKDWIIGLWGMWKCKWHFPRKIRREFVFQNGDGKTLYKCGSQNVYFTGKER